jgi:hypothetical protein
MRGVVKVMLVLLGDGDLELLEVLDDGLSPVGEADDYPGLCGLDGVNPVVAAGVPVDCEYDGDVEPPVSMTLLSRSR